jgi:membrane-bound lytic murein transglycosylase D
MIRTQWIDSLWLSGALRKLEIPPTDGGLRLSCLPMPRVSIKLLTACVVLGAFNQACAVNAPQRAPTASVEAPSPRRVDAAPTRDLSFVPDAETGRVAAVPTLAANEAVAAATRIDATPGMTGRSSTAPQTGAARDAEAAPPLLAAASSLDTIPGNGAASSAATAPATTTAPVAPTAAATSIRQQDATTGPAAAGPAQASTPAAPPATQTRSGTDSAPVARPAAATVPSPGPGQVTVVNAPGGDPTAALTRPPAAAATAPAAPGDGGYASLWDRLRAGFGAIETESPLVQHHVAWYLNRPGYVQRMVERSKRYLHFVVGELEKRQMPLEIALLPMIESAYNPAAYSPAHAAGMWQFIPATGKHYGLQQNWWYDGRRDVMAATRAALDYLQKLYGDFGDWQLALAAYNWGEGAVGRAIERNQRAGLPTDYASLRMPVETRNYLPKLQAVKALVAEPERYGLELEDVPNQPYFTRVAMPGHMDQKRAAQLANLPLEEFRSLNPAHNRPVIAAGEGSELLLPVENAEIFAANLESNAMPLVTWTTYRLRPRESLEQVAARFGIGVATLKQVNGIGARKRPRPGSTLLVPTVHPGSPVDDSVLDDFQPPSIEDVAPQRRTYRVKRGDTVRSVAAQFDVSAADLARWNGLHGNKLRPGQRVVLQPHAAAAPRGGAGSRHVAKHGRVQANFDAPVRAAKTGAPVRHQGATAKSGARSTAKPGARSDTKQVEAGAPRATGTKSGAARHVAKPTTPQAAKRDARVARN